jgi:ABC-type Fe3+-siderophore transport system permease subunit
VLLADSAGPARAVDAALEEYRTALADNLRNPRCDSCASGRRPSSCRAALLAHAACVEAVERAAEARAASRRAAMTPGGREDKPCAPARGWRWRRRGVSFSRSRALRLRHRGTGESRALIFYEIRLPRAVLGALVGGALGLSGAALQGYLRNPLAEPSLVGVSGGAALGRGAGDPSGPVAAFALALPLGGLAAPRSAMLAVVALAGVHGGR